MAGFKVVGFGGEIPRKFSRELPDQMAEQAWNCDLSSGPLNGLPIPLLVQDLSATPTAVRRAYRFPGPADGDPDFWLPLPSEFSSVVRSPLANDTLHRLYWSNPSGAGAVDPGCWWNSYARLVAGSPNYNLGFTYPDPGIVITVVATGGTGPTVVPYIVRAYTFTYIDEYGQESSPCTPSVPVSGASDGTWTISGLPTSAPASPAGKLFPTVVNIRLYRTLTGQSGSDYFHVTDLAFGSATYADTIPDTSISSGTLLATTSFLPPLDDMDGLTGFPGGMMVGFTDNTIHFCEPNRPNAWPAAYDQSLQYKILGFGVWQTSLIVLTEGFPSSGTGAAPSNFTFSTVQVPEPCISRGSIITDLMGVYYASQNGLVMLNYFGMQNQTLSTLTKNIWLTDFHAANIVACRHRAQYLAINGTGVGFVIDYTEARLGIVMLNTFSNAVCIWNDVYRGDTYICADKKVYLWDSPDTNALVYRWRSKQFFLPSPTNLGAALVEMSSDVLAHPPVDPLTPLANADPSLVLPVGVNAVFRVLVDIAGDMVPVFECALTAPRNFLRLPSGFKEFTWQFEIVGRVPVFEVKLARTMKELAGI
jgi:hypothetical protein